MKKIIEYLIYISIFIYLVFSIWTIYNFFEFNQAFPSLDNPTANENNIRANLGAFGDFFGGILNPLIGLIGIVLLFLTLKITIDELKNTQQKFEEANKLVESKNQEDEIYKSFELLLELERDVDKNRSIMESISVNLIDKITHLQKNKKDSNLLIITILEFAEKYSGKN